jgi:ABC-type transport system substrate-binding protein
VTATRHRLAVLVAVVAVAALAGAGCTEKDGKGRVGGAAKPDPSGSASGSGSASAEGTVRLAVPEEPASLNPFDPRARTLAAAAILGEVLPQLFKVDPAGHAVGSVADEATVKEMPGATGAAFSLRPGAQWSDGTTMSADDLRFTLEAVRSGAWPGARAGYDRVTELAGDGPNVALTFDGPFPGWRRLFSGEDFVLPAHRLRGKDLKNEWTAGPDLAGGPFRLGTVTPGLEVVLERNDRWWGAKPKVRVVRVLVVPDVRTMEQLLERNELDLAWPPANSNRIGRFRALSGVHLSVAPPGGRIVSLVANTETLPTERRAALLRLPDRDRFVAVLLAGEARKATSLTAGDPGSGTWAEVPGAQDFTGAGLGPDVTTTLVASQEDPMAPLLGRVLESRARTKDAQLELKYAEATEVDGTWLPEGSFDLAVVDEVEWPKPCWRCQFGDASVGRGNVARVQGFEALAVAADRGEPSAAALLERRLRSDAVLLPLWRPAAVLAARGMQGTVANSWATGPFWRAEEWSLGR